MTLRLENAKKLPPRSLSFRELLEEEANLEEWLAGTDTKAAAERGLRPNLTECIGFKIPLVFSESGNVPDNAYLADLYEHVSFLGDLHRQISKTPNGAKVTLRTKP
ncbi:MAG TPA: hypothetical protein VGD64_14545 [Acidisarcina sp.]